MTDREKVNLLVPGDTFEVPVHRAAVRPTLMADNSVIAHAGIADQAYVELIAISSQLRFGTQTGRVVANDGDGGVTVASAQFAGELYLEDQGAVRFTASSALDAAIGIIRHVRTHGMVDPKIIQEKIDSLKADG